MITNRLYRKLRALIQSQPTLQGAADLANLDVKTARKYRQSDRLPAELHLPHTWRTRLDPFQELWPDIQSLLENNSGLQAKTIFQDLQRRHPGKFPDSQLRTLQRHIKHWRATAGPPKPIYFPQQHHPGLVCASDFTSMDSLRVTIAGQPFDHLFYHFVLTYSNWESVSICFSESFESLAQGLENALWQLGGVPTYHRTDRLTAAVNNNSTGELFQQRYQALLSHYHLKPQVIAPATPNQNGDVEQAHNRLYQALDQALMLRNSREFDTRCSYAKFVDITITQRNSARDLQFQQELKALKPLPSHRLNMAKVIKAKVDPNGLIRVKGNTYSVDSRLTGEEVTARIHAESIEIYLGSSFVDSFPRLMGKNKCRINYRHVINSLVKKPHAFPDYRYREEMFPTMQFRATYDILTKECGREAPRIYLEILQHAAVTNEAKVDNALSQLLTKQQIPSLESVLEILGLDQEMLKTPTVKIDQVDLRSYDKLLNSKLEEANEPDEKPTKDTAVGEPQGAASANDAAEV